MGALDPDGADEQVALPEGVAQSISAQTLTGASN
jgi:hypothetical protein